MRRGGLTDGFHVGRGPGTRMRSCDPPGRGGFVPTDARLRPSTDPRFSLPPDPLLSRWSALASATQALVDALATTPQIEYLGMVSYAQEGTWCEVFNTTTDVNQQLDTAHSLTISAMQGLSGIVFNGGTNIHAGIDTGITALTNSSYARPYAAKTVVVFTDCNLLESNPPVTLFCDAIWQSRFRYSSCPPRLVI